MTRTCRSCKQPFASAEAIRIHRRDYICRTTDALRAIGWKQTPKGWAHPAGKYVSEYAKAKRRS